MAIISKDKLMEIITTKFEGADDETLHSLEDITDTIDDYDKNANIDWKRKYDENDESWRTRYRERFEHPPETAEVFSEEKEEKELTYENLFERK